MKLKHCLILLTIISVVADTMLLPFYPQFFQQAFGAESTQHVGYYIAACCFTVMVTFPFWARLARKVDELHIWVYTQLAAACLGLYCYHASSLVEFWIASQLMLAFKASYLLIYPFAMRLEDKDKHLGVVGLFAVLLHFGAIGGALLGGFILQYLDPRDVYLVMPLSDLLQVGVCLYLLRTLKPAFYRPQPVSEEAGEPGADRPHGLVLRLCIVSMLFYFSAFLVRPFFARYWESFSPWNGEVASALVYSIPAWVALFCLWWSQRGEPRMSNFGIILASSVVAVVALYLQSIPETWSVFIGRCLYGFALYQVTVRLEVFLFSISEPEHYASDFSKTHFFQNLGVLGASFLVGYLVDLFGYGSTFQLSLLGFALSGICFYLLFRAHHKSSRQADGAQDKGVISGGEVQGASS